MTLKAIVIDDDQIIRKTLGKFLQELGFSVLFAENGNTALEVIETSIPDLVISDMLIPGAHGIEICKYIKNHSGLSEIKVILMSSLYKRSDINRNGTECAYDGFLKKPFNFDDLVSIIRLMGFPGFN